MRLFPVLPVLLTVQFQKYFLEKETSVGAQITYAQVDDEAPRNCRTPEGYLITREAKEPGRFQLMVQC